MFPRCSSQTWDILVKDPAAVCIVSGGRPARKHRLKGVSGRSKCCSETAESDADDPATGLSVACPAKWKLYISRQQIDVWRMNPLGITIVVIPFIVLELFTKNWLTFQIIILDVEIAQGALNGVFIEVSPVNGPIWSISDPLVTDTSFQYRWTARWKDSWVDVVNSLLGTGNDLDGAVLEYTVSKSVAECATIKRCPPRILEEIRSRCHLSASSSNFQADDDVGRWTWNGQWFWEGEGLDV